MRYRVTIRGSKGDFERVVECHSVDFPGAWWVAFRDEHGRVIASVPAESLVWFYAEAV